MATMYSTTRPLMLMQKRQGRQWSRQRFFHPTTAAHARAPRTQRPDHNHYVATRGNVEYSVLNLSCFYVRPSAKCGKAESAHAENLIQTRGLRDRNSPSCTLSQNGYGARSSNLWQYMSFPSPSKCYAPLFYHGFLVFNLIIVWVCYYSIN